jgi:hypothetical protein
VFCSLDRGEPFHARDIRPSANATVGTAERPVRDRQGDLEVHRRQRVRGSKDRRLGRRLKARGLLRAKHECDATRPVHSTPRRFPVTEFARSSPEISPAVTAGCQHQANPAVMHRGMGFASLAESLSYSGTALGRPIRPWHVRRPKAIRLYEKFGSEEGGAGWADRGRLRATAD